MSTLLQEILTEQEVLKMPPGDITKAHKGKCTCLQCTHGVAGPSHKNWRQRRNTRYYKPAQDCKTAEQQEMEEQFLGSILDTAVKIGSGIANAVHKTSEAASKLPYVTGKIPKSPISRFSNRKANS